MQRVSHQLATGCCVLMQQTLVNICWLFLTQRADQSDGGDHEAHGGHRGEGGEVETDHCGHARFWRCCEQH